jgi:hypothetical protein
MRAIRSISIDGKILDWGGNPHSEAGPLISLLACRERVEGFPRALAGAEI